MTSLELLDSKRFCSFMDEGAAAWGKASDAERAKMLDALASWLGGCAPAAPLGTTPEAPAQFVQLVAVADKPLAIPKRKGGRPKGSKNAKPEPESADKATLKAEMTRELTAEEKRQILAEAALVPPARDPQLIVNDAVMEVIKPNWATTPQTEGFRHFIVNAERKGERVSFELDKWKSALATAGLSAGTVTFKPEGLGMSPGSLDTGRSGNKWRVMIG